MQEYNPPSLKLTPPQVDALVERLELALAPLNRCLTRTVRDRLGSRDGFALAEQDEFQKVSDEISTRLFGIVLHALVPEECGKGPSNTVEDIKAKFTKPNLFSGGTR